LARDLTDSEQEFCRALGEVVVFWNHVEQSFRILLHRATFLGGPDGRIWALIAPLTPVQLKDAMMALSADHAPERQEHLHHCAMIFDREREYRNHYVHGPLTFLTTESSSEALISAVASRGGNLRIQKARVTSDELLEFRNRLGVLQAYIGDLLEDSHTLRNGRPLSELVRPPLHPAPTVVKHGWWEGRD
jgi:hypothetical protein